MGKPSKAVSLFQLIPLREFEQLCDRFQIDKKVRKLTARKQVWALVMAFILKLQSLREVESTLGIPRSTLSDACANREARFFEELCRLVLWKIYAHLKARKVKQAVRTLLALDSTEARVHGSLSRLEKWKAKSWSKIEGKASCKLHVIWNINGQWIEEFCVTAGRDHDQTAAKKLKLRAHCTYVFDRAYTDLSWWWKIIKADSDLVSRFRDCSRRRRQRLSLWKDDPNAVGVLYDGIWTPSKFVLWKNPEVPKDFKLRHIVYRDPETKKVFDFVSSHFDLPAQHVADIYRKRWAVELLFRWMKGHLNVRALEPRSVNAIRIQLTIAVLVQLLMALLRLLIGSTRTLWECLRALRSIWARGGFNHATPQKSEDSEPFIPECPSVGEFSPCYP